ncbi:MAG: hypothetical protein V8R43_06250 [Dorea sp.]
MVGPLKEDICEELGVDPMQVIAVASHDTQSASAAVPTQEKDFIFISCGTWSLYGTELEEPVIGEKSLEMTCRMKADMEERLISLTISPDFGWCRKADASGSVREMNIALASWRHRRKK